MSEFRIPWGPYLKRDTYYKQNVEVGQRIFLWFHNQQLKRPLQGVLLRSDRGHPRVDVIQLDDGRIILGSECHVWEPQIRSTE